MNPKVMKELAQLNRRLSQLEFAIYAKMSPEEFQAAKAAGRRGPTPPPGEEVVDVEVAGDEEAPAETPVVTALKVAQAAAPRQPAKNVKNPFFKFPTKP